MSGVANEIVVGDKSTVSIAGSIFNLKKIYNLVLDTPVQTDVNTGGTNYSFGSNHDKLRLVIELSTPELATVIPWQNRDANGDKTQLAVIILLVPVGGGANVTMSFNVKSAHQEFGHATEEAKLLASIDFVVTSSTITVT